MTLNLQPKAGCSGYLIELPGLPMEFGAIVLAHNHQHAAGWVCGLPAGRFQELLWAGPLSVLPGLGQGGAVRTPQSLLPGSGPAVGWQGGREVTHGVRRIAAF